MGTLVEKLGLDWKLLLSQGANFLLLLVVLRLAVYKPLLKVMAERRRKIEEGLEKAQEADRRLGAISEMQKEKLREAEAQGMEVIRTLEARGRDQEKKIVTVAEGRSKEILERAQEAAMAASDAAMDSVEQEAVKLVKQILTETVNVSPAAVDEALIAKVASSIGKKT